jgi:hypothetical protein
MPCIDTLKAHILVAFRALNLVGVLASLHYPLAVWSGAEFFLTTHCNLMIFAEFQKLLESIIVNESFKEVLRDH